MESQQLSQVMGVLAEDMELSHGMHFTLVWIQLTTLRQRVLLLCPLMAWLGADTTIFMCESIADVTLTSSHLD